MSRRSGDVSPPVMGRIAWSARRIFDRIESRLNKSKTRRNATCSVTWTTPRPDRRVALEIEHHRVIGGVAPLGKDLGVPGMFHAGLVQRLLVQGKRRDRVDPSGERQVDRGIQERRRRRGRPGGRPRRARHRRDRRNRPGWASTGSSPVSGLASSGASTTWTPDRPTSSDQSSGAAEDARVTDHDRAGQRMEFRIEPAADDHLGADPGHVAHRQADQRKI